MRSTPTIPCSGSSAWACPSAFLVTPPTSAFSATFPSNTSSRNSPRKRTATGRVRRASRILSQRLTRALSRSRPRRRDFWRENVIEHGHHEERQDGCAAESPNDHGRERPLHVRTKSGGQ